LVFGPEAADRVWLVVDGDTLYVDRNGNGDLTEPGEKIVAKAEKSHDPAESGYTFEAGDLHVCGKTHKRLLVTVIPLTLYASSPALAHSPPLQAALTADPRPRPVSFVVDVESARLKGGGVDGRLSYHAGFHDPDGVLQFADRPAAAPVIHL